MNPTTKTILDYIEQLKHPPTYVPHPYYLHWALYDWLVANGQISPENKIYERVEWKEPPNPNAYMLECVHPVVRKYLEE